LDALTNDQIEKLAMLLRKMRKHIALLSLIMPLAAITISLVVSIPSSASDKLRAPFTSWLSQRHAHEDGFHTSVARRPRPEAGLISLPGMEARRKRSTIMKLAATLSERDQAMSQTTDLNVRANELLNPIKEILDALIADNTKLKANVAELRAELGDVRKALIAANERYNAEQKKSDQLADELRNLSTVAKRDAEALTSRQQKLLAAQQAAIISKETIVKLQTELGDVRKALIAANERYSACRL
jgi:small-conductance mechanosensitive channel